MGSKLDGKLKTGSVVFVATLSNCHRAIATEFRESRHAWRKLCWQWIRDNRVALFYDPFNCIDKVWETFPCFKNEDCQDIIAACATGANRRPYGKCIDPTNMS